MFDVSPKGAFIRPYDLYSSALTEGSMLRLSFAPNNGERDVLGTIRWIGFSQEHACRGFGVEFAEVQADVPSP